MTKDELRALYVLNKRGGKARHSEVQQAMSRVPLPEIKAALARLEELNLVSSGMSPSKTRPALLYWLTIEGKAQVVELIAKGDIGE